MDASPTWTNRFPGTVAGITDAAGWVDGIAAAQHFPEDLSYAIQLCVEELLVNAVRHGGGQWEGEAPGDAPPVTLWLTLTRGAGAVSLVVEDDGTPFDGTTAPLKPLGQPLEEVEPGGLGLRLVRQFAGGMSYVREGGRNRTTLNFPWPQTANSLL